MVHWPAVSTGALMLDDNEYLGHNELVQHPGWASAGRFLGEVVSPSTVTGYYQPLTMISLMLDYAAGGRPDNLGPFHRTNLVLHVMNTVLVIVVLQMLLGRPWAAASVGLLFGVHPLAVEPIAWVGERKTLLATFFALWCLACYVRYARRGSRLLYGLCLASYVLSLLSKPTAATLPLVLLLADFWPLRRLSGRAVLEKVPFVAIGGAFGVITVVSQRHLDWMASSPFSAGQTLLLACHNLAFYPWKMIWPADLSPFYAFPGNVSLSNGMLAASVVVCVAVLVFLVISLRWTRAVFAGGLCFGLLLSPTLLNKGYSPCIAWDKYAYLPSIGLLIVLAWLLSRVWEAVSGRVHSRLWRGGIPGVALVIVAALAAATRSQLAHWRTTEGLYEYMLRLAPGAAVPHYNLGVILADSGRLSEAVTHYEAALRLRPEMPDADNNLGNALAKLGRRAEAIVHLERALRLKPDDAKAYNNIGNVLSDQGKLDEAIESYGRALEFDPKFAAAHSNLAIALSVRGRPDRAVEHYKRALALAPDLAEAHNNLGAILVSQGKAEEAIEHYTRALQTAPGFVEAHRNLGLALAGRGDLEGAIAQYREALRLRPEDPKTRELLGVALTKAGRVAEASQHYAEWARLDPTYVHVERNRPQPAR